MTTQQTNDNSTEVLQHITPNTLALENQLADLRSDAYRFIIFFLGFMSYLWLLMTVWPPRGYQTPIEIWIGSIQFACGVITSYVLHRAKHPSAYPVLITSFTVAIVLLDLNSNVGGIVYTLSLPVIFSSVLLRRSAVLVTGTIASGSAFWISYYDPMNNSTLIEAVIPMGVIALITIMSLLAVRNLHTALIWAMTNYARANHHKRIAQEQQAELKRTLKSLDTATYNLNRANYMLTLARNRAEEAQRLKQQFAQNISHELRTPLNLIIGFIETIIESPEYYGSQLAPAYLRDLGIVHRNATHLQNLVNDVLDLARIEIAQLTITTEVTDVRQLVQDTVDTARSLVESRGLYLKTDIASDIPPIRVDSTRIRQVIFNLLSNAARFTDRGGIIVKAYRDNGNIVFAVIDTGIGISQTDKDHIFDAFHQAETTAQRQQGGAGLGLAISREFVLLHGGNIWVESKVDAGSTFFFSIPVEHLINYETHHNQHRPMELSIGQLAQERIVLTITRSPSAAAMLARYISDCRHIFVKDLIEAQEFIQHTTPQTVIIDTVSYPQDHVSLQAMVEDWQVPHLPVIACPMPGEESLRQKLATRGFLTKPVSRESLWNILRHEGDEVDRVLVIDDDRDTVHLINRILYNPVRRYNVYNAYSGQEGLTMMKFYQPDVVLMDLGLPDIEGLQMLKIIQDDPEIRNIPIIIVTARDEVDMIETLTGTMLVTKYNGLMRGEITQWIQEILDTTTRIRHITRLSSDATSQ